MATNKTTETDADVSDFIQHFAATDQQRADSFALVGLMESVTGCKAKMWGPSIVGFGSYHYKYESGHEGDAPLLGFSPRKAAIGLYVFTGAPEHEYLLNSLGRFKRGKACLYVKRLSDIDREQLKVLMKETMDYLHGKYGKKEQ